MVPEAGLEPAQPFGRGIFLPHLVAQAVAVKLAGRCGLDYIIAAEDFQVRLQPAPEHESLGTSGV
ncbi:hypothetical protein HQ520_19030 [bacterium]|nr:hypothetical protein [bacterium]